MAAEEVDPAANSHRAKADRPRPTDAQPATSEVVAEKPKIERVVSEGGVVEKKKGIGTKFRELVGGADAKGAATYVLLEVMIPAARGMAVEVGTKFVERIFYPDAAPPGRRLYGPTVGSRVTYNGPQGYRPAASRPPLGRPLTPGLGGGFVDRPSTNYIIASRKEAEEVVERMGDLLEIYTVISVADLHDLIGIRGVHTDNKWGWDNLRGVEVRPVKEGFQITVPPPQPINY